MDSRITRRALLKSTAVAGAALAGPYVVSAAALGLEGAAAPSGRIVAAQVGVGMMGTGDVQAFMKLPDVQVVAVCDVDKKRVNVDKRVFGSDLAREIVEKHYAEKKSSGAYKGCAVYVDYRELLEKEKGLDAVMVATPDHAHAVVSIAAMKKGKHVYCQKPLTRSVYEARQMAEVARRAKVATQCGTSNYTAEGAYRMCEMIADGAIGAVREVHNWSNRPVWPQGLERPTETPPVPEGLDWNLWLGPAPERPYHPIYLPFVWRGWWDFGTGALGDMGCYSFDVIFRALKLAYPTKVEACGSRLHGKPTPESFPQASIVRYQFPGQGGGPAINLTWYDGGLTPARPEELDAGKPLSEWNGGILFVGEKGKMLCDFVGANPRLISEAKMGAYPPPAKTLPRSIGHKEEWLRAIRGGQPAGANFEVAGRVCETLAVGNIALRTGKELLWDGPNMKVTNAADANRYVKEEYRAGWTL